MHLPPSLPLPPRHLSYLGSSKRSKREARRPVAFRAVKRLRRLDVFDDYLLPVSSQVHKADKQRVTHVPHVPAIMTVSGILGVCDSNPGSIPSLLMDVRLLDW